MAVRRLTKELKDIESEPLPNVTAWVDGDDMFSWKGKIIGPSETPCENGIFLLDILLPNCYPFSPPRIKFITKVFHCNIHESGGIALDVLQDNWSGALTIRKALLSISSLLCDPNPDIYMNPVAAKLYKTNRAKHDKTAREWTLKYAIGQD